MADPVGGAGGASNTSAGFEQIKGEMEAMFLQAQRQNLEVSKIQTQGNTNLRVAKATPNG